MIRTVKNLLHVAPEIHNRSASNRNNVHMSPYPAWEVTVFETQAQDMSLGVTRQPNMWWFNNIFIQSSYLEKTVSNMCRDIFILCLLHFFGFTESQVTEKQTTSDHVTQRMPSETMGDKVTTLEVMVKYLQLQIEDLQNQRKSEK